MIKYAALKKQKSGSVRGAGRPASRQFPFAEGHPLFLAKAQVFRSKQPTLIPCSRIPKLPGDEPSDHNSKEHDQWKKRADKFAMYALTVFRPESDLYDKTQTNTLGYRYSDYCQWIQHLNNDSSILSKLRLRAMYTHLHGMDSHFASKQLAAEYRGRNRTLWSDDERATYFAARVLNGSKSVSYTHLTLPTKA